jgi:uncharacterized protein YjbI with pentapeptide repeats
MPTSLTSESPSGFVCDCEEWMRSACSREPFNGEYEGKRYCVLHFPSKEKSAAFKEAVKEKLEKKDFNFRGAWFPEEITFQDDFTSDVDFQHAVFSKDVSFSGRNFAAGVNFNRATFEGETSFYSVVFGAAVFFGQTSFQGFVNFRSANFQSANFNSADFRDRATFFRADFTKGAIFDGATFRAVAEFREAGFRDDAYLSTVTFHVRANFNEACFSSRTNFISSTFIGKVDFGSAIFKAHADFSFANFLDQATFEGRFLFNNRSSLNLESARIEKQGDVSFHTTFLRPHWFLNVDARKVEFTNVDWHWRRLGVMVHEEIEGLKEKSVAFPHRMLAIVCRQLAVNSEENYQFEDASNFRYMAMEAQRSKQFPGLAFGRLSFWYWVASGFGERVLRAFLVLLGIWLLAGLFYTGVGFARSEPKLANESDYVIAKRDEVGTPLPLLRALTYSAAVMTFQKPEPRPATTAAQFVVLLETILGPVQAALLALAIRRKFMR